MPAQNPLILFVHDSREERARATDVLGAVGCRVAVAEDAAGALAACLADGPALVVADTTLRGESGYALGRKLREDVRCAATSLVFLAGPEGERAATQAGAMALLRKPLHREEARGFVSGALAQPEERAALEAALARSRAQDASGAMSGLRALVERAAGSVIGSWAQYHLGVLLHGAGDAQAALEDWSALLDEDPAFWRAHVRLGAVFEAAGDPTSAVAHYRAALAEHADLAAIRARADALARSRSAAIAAPAEIGDHEDPKAGEMVAAEIDDAEIDDDEAASGNEGNGVQAGGAAGAMQTILVADDSELALEMIRDVLQRAGFRVVTATDGRKALELARSERPDLMVLDGLMPGATGFDVCKQVKETIYPGNAPKVVILSAIYTKQRQKSEAIELYKVDDVLSKPFDDAEFIATVRKHLA